MEPLRTAWRAGDVVAYDEMREAANAVIAALLRLGRSDEIDREQALTDAAEVRAYALSVDGYDRDAVDAARADLDARLAALPELSR
jgi:hypothetical protein